MTEAELQTDEELGTEDVSIDETESGEELAPSKAPEGFIKAEDAQKDINKQHRKYRDEERARKRVEAEKDRLAKELAELKAKTVDLTVPPPPDPYSDNYEDQIRARDEAIQRKAEHDAQQRSIEDQQKRHTEEQALHEEQALQEKVAAFDTNMVKLGLNPVEVKKAANTLIDYGVSDTLQDILLEDSEGPLLATYLANNPIELEALGGMSTLQLVNHLNGTVRQKASLLKPKTSKAPDPPMTLSGGGVQELEDPLLAGVTFE